MLLVFGRKQEDEKRDFLALWQQPFGPGSFGLLQVPTGDNKAGALLLSFEPFRCWSNIGG